MLVSLVTSLSTFLRIVPIDYLASLGLFSYAIAEKEMQEVHRWERTGHERVPFSLERVRHEK